MSARGRRGEAGATVVVRGAGNGVPVLAAQLVPMAEVLSRRSGRSLERMCGCAPSIQVDVPWNLTIGENSSVGDHAILYCLGPVTLGRHVTISQYALCAGTHETNTRRMLLLKPPITIGG